MRINNSKYHIQAVDIPGCPDDQLSEFLFLGRSNVGKSSFINALTNNKKLARTSSTPGKTQTLVFFDINEGQFRIVDAPGYGFAKVPKKIREQFASMMDIYLNERENLKHIFLLMDSRHNPSVDDMGMYEYLKYFNKPFTIIVTKCDKHSNNQMVKVRKQFIEQFPEDNIVYVSSVNKSGIEDILNIMEKDI